LGFTRAVVPRGTGLGPLQAAPGLQVLESSTLAEALVGALGVNPEEDWIG
jgi:DNA repair protein RadA/Sms